MSAPVKAKLMKQWVVFNPLDCDHEYYPTEAAALQAARDLIDQYNDGDGWPEETDEIHVAQVTHAAVQTNVKRKEDLPAEEQENWNPDWEFTCDYEMKPVEAT